MLSDESVSVALFRSSENEMATIKFIVSGIKSKKYVHLIFISHKHITDENIISSNWLPKEMTVLQIALLNID